MANQSEPPEKKQKLYDERSQRTIRVDLTGLPQWVREASDETLVKVFKMGVMVKDSMELNVSFKEEFINDLLTEKLDPMSKTIDSLAQNVSDETKSMKEETKTTTENFQKQVSSSIDNIGQQVQGLTRSVINEVKTMENSLVSNVQTVVGKVPSLNTITTEIGNVQKNVSDKVDTVTDKLNTNIIPSLARFEKKLDDMTTMYSKATTKGAVGEAQVIVLLKELKSHTFEDVATRRDTKGDIHATSPQEDKYLIEVKKHKGPVPAREIEKFETDVQSSPEFKVGILLSLHSGIAKRAVGRRFQIVSNDRQFFIYVPHLLSDTNLAVWSVLLADELVAINQENLNDEKLAAVRNLYEEFTRCMEGSKKCKENLEVLKRTVKSLEENLDPLLKVVREAKAKLNTVLHK